MLPGTHAVMARRSLASLALALFMLLQPAPARTAGRVLPDPATPHQVIEIYPSDANATCDEEFEDLANALQPGDELVLHGGTYTQTCRRAITAIGTPQKPIVIRAADGELPVLTRPQPPDHNYPQNNIEIVDSAYLVVRGLHFWGGDIGVRMIGGHHITFEENEVSETGNNAIAMNSGDTDSFILRRNHIHHTGLLDIAVGTTEGEGMYVGCNNAGCVASNHLIENNYIHHLRGTSGGGNDGIEVKVGSHGNAIRDNVIHDTTIGTRYPCIFVYGGGPAPNLVEGNALWNCGEAIQVVSDAVVRNNLILNSDVGITAAPHAQVAQIREVTIAHNTVYGHGECLYVRWTGATDMVLANNAVYCPGTSAVDAAGLGGSAVAVSTNHVEGALAGVSIDGSGFFAGGTAAGVFGNPAALDFWPQPASSLIGAADPDYAAATDFNAHPRTSPPDVGAYETDGLASNPGWQVVAGFKEGTAPPVSVRAYLPLVVRAAPIARTALGQLAGSMAPGTWAELETIDINPTLQASGSSGMIFGYAEYIKWDPLTEQLLYVGGDHGDTPKFVSYSAATNTWQELEGQPWMQATSHGYDHSGMNPVTGDFYHRPFGSRTVYRFNTLANQWSALPSIPDSVMDYNNCCVGIDYFPELGGLVYASVGNNNLILWQESTQGWLPLASGLTMGGYHSFAEYNPVHRVVVFGGGNAPGSRNIYQVDRFGQITPLKQAPFDLGVQWGAVFSVDPVSGDYLVLRSNGEFHRYDVTLDAWSLISASTPVTTTRYGNPIHGVVATPVGTYGVTLFVTCDGADCKVTLYKHSATPTPRSPSPERADSAVDKSQWVEGTQALDDGATRDYYNRAAWLAWQHTLGDWRDAADIPQGDAPYSAVSMMDDDTPEYIEWDVTDLVQAWLDGDYLNQGITLRSLSGGTFDFSSREHPSPTQRPELVITTPQGTITLGPEADTHLDSSTYQGFGDDDALRVSGGNNTLIRFDLGGLAGGTQLIRATLRLFVFAEYGSGTIGVFRSSQGHALPPSDPVYGLAALYSQDQGLAGHPDVLLFSDFESDSWGDDWSYGSSAATLVPLSADPARNFAPLQGRALRVEVPQGENTGMNVGFEFDRETGSEPEEIYLRYYLRFANDWDPLDGGKMPGIAGTYGVAGWGGRPSDGTNGWSARGSFSLVPPAGNPLGGTVPLGHYVYHADMQGTYGDIVLWQNDYRGYLQKDRWYCIEQYLRMNTPGLNDGVLRAWVDGRLAYEQTDWRWRDVSDLKIEEIWMNVYHGGSTAPDQDLHLYLDNVVIARRYIGPLAQASLRLNAAPGDQLLRLSWSVNATLPVTSTWQVAYQGPPGDQPSPIEGLPGLTRAFTLTGLTNYTSYTVTLKALVGSTPILTDTVLTMPTDIFIHTPLIRR